MKGGITRAKEHLIGKRGNVSKCIKVPKEVKEELIKYMKQKKRQCSEEVEVPNAMELDLDNLGFRLSEEDAEGIDDIPDPRPRVREPAGALKGPMHLFGRNLKTAVGKRNKAKLRQQNIREACDKEVPNLYNKRRKPPHFSSVVRMVMKNQDVMHLMAPIIEPLVRRVIREEVELVLKKNLTSMKQTSGKEVHTFESREKADAQNLVISTIQQGEKFSCYEDEASLMDGDLHTSTIVLYSSNPPNTEGSSGNKLLAPQETGGPNYTQANASSPDIMSSIYCVGGTSGLDDFCLPNFDGMGLGYDQSLGFPGQDTNALICDTDPVAHAFDEDYLEFFLY